MYCDIRLRFVTGTMHDIGPGVIELLEEINFSGSVLEASRRTKMSYSKALKILKNAELGCKNELIQSRSGGAKGGSSVLTEYAKNLVKVYREIENATYATATDCYLKYKDTIESLPSEHD